MTNKELIHRLEMVMDDARVLINHLNEGKQLDSPTPQADNGHIHLANIHIALDFESDESLGWIKFE